MRFASIIFILLFLVSCSNKYNLTYLQNSENYKSNWQYPVTFNKIEIGDILKIDVSSTFNEAALPYNKSIEKINSNMNNTDVLKLEGYLVNDSGKINFPIINDLSVIDLTINELENKLKNLLINGGHLSDPTVNVRILNSKFTVLGEVRNPGTFHYYEEKINIFQALGYAGDLTIDGKRKNITFIRHDNKTKKVYKIKLTDTNILNSSLYFIKNNDVIIVNPSFNKVKSAGFIGSPSSIASISSLLLSITLLLINN